MISPASRSGATFDMSWRNSATSGDAAMKAIAIGSPSRTCMRSPPCWTRRACSGSCAANCETVWIVPVISTLLTGDTSELTRLKPPPRGIRQHRGQDADLDDQPRDHEVELRERDVEDAAAGVRGRSVAHAVY